MKANNLNTIIYSITDKPPFYALILLGLQHVVKFSLLLICPLLILNAANATAIAQQVISLSLIAAALATLLMAMRYKIGAGYFIPAQASVPYFAVSLMAAKSGGMPLVFGVTVLLGLLQCGVSFLLPFCKRLIDEATIGFIILMLGLWAALLGVSELFYPGNLGQLMVHGTFLQNQIKISNSLLGYITLALMLALRLTGYARLYCVLIGILMGWLLSYFTGQLLSDKLYLLAQSKWFALPSFSLPHYAFNWHWLPLLILISLLASFELTALVATVQNSENQTWQTADFTRIRRGNLAAGFSVLVSGLIGGIAQSPVPGSIGDLIITGAYSRLIAFIYAPLLFLLAFSPKLAMLMLTIPAAVNGAAIVFMGATLGMQGLTILQIEKLKPYHLQAFSLAFLLGMSADLLPMLYFKNANPFPYFTNAALAIGLFSYLILRYLFSMGQAKTA